MSPPKKRPAPKMNAGVQAQLTKRLADAAAMIDRLTAALKEKEDELVGLRDHSAAQDMARRTDETKHSEEFVLVLAELKRIGSCITTLSSKG